MRTLSITTIQMKEINNFITMKTKLQNAIFTMACMLITITSFSQDVRLTQSYANPLRVNPSIMGANTDMKFMLNYRMQWAAIEKGYTTYSFTGIYPIFLNQGKSKLDIGISGMQDKAGAFSTLDMALAVDYSKEIAPNNNLCLSLIGGYVQRSLDVGKLTFDNQYVLGTYNASNPSKEATLVDNVGHPDLGVGFMWFLNPSRTEAKLNAFLGLSAYHLTQPNATLLGTNGKIPMRFNYQAGVKIFGDKKIDFSPNVRVNMQNGNVEAAAGMYIDYNFSDNAKLVIGSWYRRNDAIAVLLGFEHKSFTIGYSYDFVNTNLNVVTTGVNAHEITLSYKFSRLGKSKIASFGGGDNGSSIPSVRTGPFASF
jgi:type IX secretion system PorP/SprF family membrane protein